MKSLREENLLSTRPVKTSLQRELSRFDLKDPATFNGASDLERVEMLVPERDRKFAGTFVGHRFSLLDSISTSLRRAGCLVHIILVALVELVVATAKLDLATCTGGAIVLLFFLLYHYRFRKICERRLKLFRFGVLSEGTLVRAQRKTSLLRGYDSTTLRVKYQQNGQTEESVFNFDGWRDEVEEGAEVPVLLQPGGEDVAIFLMDGHAILGRRKR